MAVRINWSKISDEQLLELRLKDLPVRLEGSVIERRLATLYRELAARGVNFRPRAWLSEEWFTPDNVPGFAVPFYLAHPRLMKLERRQMLEVEGGPERECLRIMRHEAGHAISNAYRLHLKRGWRQQFGLFSSPYPKAYRPKPASRDFVVHLGAWYAQAHPAEDFAETFAVWLRPGSRWRQAYRGWPALRKLEYVDQTMGRLAGRRPPNKRAAAVDELSRLGTTLGEHYRRKREYYAVTLPAYYDRDLHRIFADEFDGAGRSPIRPTAAAFLREARRELRDEVADATGVHHYTVDHVLKSMIDRCRALKLNLTGERETAKRRAAVALAAQTMNVAHAGYHRIPL